jgi:hypothetical protein
LLRTVVGNNCLDSCKSLAKSHALNKNFCGFGIPVLPLPVTGERINLNSKVLLREDHEKVYGRM